jgi:hypothetical protein
MTARGDVIRGQGVLPLHGVWDSAREWAERQSARDKTFIFLVTLVTILGVGLVVYGFYDALQTLRMANLPDYWSVKPF